MAYLFQPLAKFCSPLTLAASVSSARLRSYSWQQGLELLFLVKRLFFHFRAAFLSPHRRLPLLLGIIVLLLPSWRWQLRAVGFLCR